MCVGGNSARLGFSKKFWFSARISLASVIKCAYYLLWGGWSKNSILSL